MTLCFYAKAYGQGMSDEEVAKETDGLVRPKLGHRG